MVLSTGLAPSKSFEEQSVDSLEKGKRSVRGRKASNLSTDRCGMSQRAAQKSGQVTKADKRWNNSGEEDHERGASR